MKTQLLLISLILLNGEAFAQSITPLNAHICPGELKEYRYTPVDKTSKLIWNVSNGYLTNSTGSANYGTTLKTVTANEYGQTYVPQYVKWNDPIDNGVISVYEENNSFNGATTGAFRRFTDVDFVGTPVPVCGSTSDYSIAVYVEIISGYDDGGITPGSLSLPPGWTYVGLVNQGAAQSPNNHLSTLYILKFQPNAQGTGPLSVRTSFSCGGGLKYGKYYTVQTQRSAPTYAITSNHTNPNNGSNYICVGSTTTFSVGALAGSTFNWSVPSSVASA